MMNCFDYTFILVLIWYTSSTGFSLFLQEFFYSNKANNNNANISSTICLTVFIQNLSCWCGIILLYIVFILAKRKGTNSSISQLLGQDLNKIKDTKKTQIIFIFAGVLHCMGTLIMNFMLTLSNIPCAHTIRALEPLLAGILVYFIPMPKKNEQSNETSKINNIEKSVGTILMLCGAILATWRSGQCESLSTILFLGMLTNLIMVFRNICIQHISVKNDEIFTQVILYGVSTLLSFLLLIINDFSYILLREHGTILCLIGLCSFIYNSTSIIVCGRIPLVSHSLLTMLKRPTLILASTIYFHIQLSLSMIIGNLIIVIGIIFYKINLIILLSISRRLLYFIMSSLIIISGIVIIFPSLFYTNQNDLLSIRTVNMDKDFPVFYWKPNKNDDNFGDKLSLILLTSIVGSNISSITNYDSASICRKPKLLAIGSILNHACRNDVVWGSGALDPRHLPPLNAKEMHTLDIRAVRGPRTRNLLISKGYRNVPEVYGDPAMLLPYYFTSYKKLEKPLIPVLFIPHFLDMNVKPSKSQINRAVTAPAFLPWNQLLSLIVQSELVVASSLHGIIISEAFGIPARAVISKFVNQFKFHDYYESTNRTFRYASTIEQAIEMGGEKPPFINLTKLLNAFPSDKFRTHQNG